MARTKQELAAEKAAERLESAAEKAADRLVASAKLAVDSASAAAASASSTVQIMAAVASTKLEGLEKQFEHHEKLDAERFASLAGWMKTTFFTLVGATGTLAFYMLTHR